MSQPGTGMETVGGSSENRPATGTLLKQAVTAMESVTGTNLVDVIRQTLETPSIYVFGELLDVDNVKALAGTEFEPYLSLLKLFAYGTYSEYLRAKQQNPTSLPDLSNAMRVKLRQLSIVSLARSRRQIPYQIILQELDINNIRELEDLIIDIIYANVIKGTMDQKNSLLVVDQTIGRDVREDDFQTITNVLGEWCRNCDNMLSNIEHQMTTANQYKEETNTAKTALENKIANVRKNLKTDNDDVIMTEVFEKGYARDGGAEKKRNVSSKFIKSSYKAGVTKSWRKD